MTSTPPHMAVGHLRVWAPVRVCADLGVSEGRRAILASPARHVARARRAAEWRAAAGEVQAQRVLETCRCAPLGRMAAQNGRLRTGAAKISSGGVGQTDGSLRVVAKSGRPQRLCPKGPSNAIWRTPLGNEGTDDDGAQPSEGEGHRDPQFSDSQHQCPNPAEERHAHALYDDPILWRRDRWSGTSNRDLDVRTRHIKLCNLGQGSSNSDQASACSAFSADHCSKLWTLAGRKGWSAGAGWRTLAESTMWPAKVVMAAALDEHKPIMAGRM